LDSPATARFRPLVASFSYFATFITLGATMSLAGPALPFLASHTSSAIAQISIIFATSSFGYMVGSLLGGRLYDRLPGHRIQSLSLLLIALTASLIPLMQSLWLLVLTIFLMGTFQGILDVGCNTLLTWIHAEKVGPFMNALHGFFGVGSFIAPLIFARVLLSLGEIHWAYWIFSLLTVPLAIWFWVMPSPPIRRKAPLEAGQGSMNGMFVLVVLFFVFNVGVELGYGNWLYTFSNRVGLANQTTGAYLTSAYWGALTFSRLMGIFISSRFRPQAILLADVTGSITGLAILLIWPASSLALWIGSIIMGLSVASAIATAITFAEQRMRLTAAMTGWILVGGGLGGMSIPWIIGQFFERVGPRVTMPILMVSILIDMFILLVLVLPRRKPGQQAIPSSQ
jgi:FHS family Na+ dependent glucose MFS transporter 1